jgi:hypothetical protein
MDIYLLKGTFVKNCRLSSEQHFTKTKGTLPPERGHLLCPLKIWGSWAPLASLPGSYAPVCVI